MRDGRELDDYSTEDMMLNFMPATHISYKNSCIMTDYQSNSVGTSTNKQMQDAECGVTQDDLIDQYENETIVQFDTNRLSRFLKSIYPTLIEALDESLSLKKLQNFKPISEVNRTETLELYTLENLANKSIEIEQQLEITDIQWNANGLTIAASYGCLEHVGQCYHQSVICAWNISARNFNPSKPSVSIETQCCMMCLQFNASRPNILAAGSFNGEVYIYDISSTNAIELAHSTIDEYFHRECITQILWLQDEQIMTLGCEGKILLWPTDAPDILLKYPLKGCYLVRKKESQTESVGGISLSRVLEDPYTFIVGSEGGSVLKAQITPINFTMTKKSFLDARDKGLIWKDEAILFMQNLNQKFLPEVKLLVENYCKERKITAIYIQQIVAAKPDLRKMYVNPLSFAYEAHYGSVFSVHHSPFIKNVFLTASMDGQFRIYTTNNARCLAVYEYAQTYLLSAQFSPTRPCVFAGCDSIGQLLIFDLLQNTQQHVVTMENPRSSASNLRFNGRQNDLIACSLSGGQIKIYQLSDELTQPQEGEIHKLQQLIS